MVFALGCPWFDVFILLQMKNRSQLQGDEWMHSER